MKNWYSKILVTLQFSLIGAEIACSHLLPHSLLAQCFLVLSLSLVLWATAAMRISNVRIMPEPKQDAVFIATGPYKYIRHPMYLSVLLLTLGYTIEETNLFTITIWCALLFVMHRKLTYEETLLMQKFPFYPDYVKQTKRLIPFVY